MSLNMTYVAKCAALGWRSMDRITLGLFGLVAPTRDHSRTPLWWLLSCIVPMLRLRPKQLKGLRLLIDPVNWSHTVIFDEIFLRKGYDLGKIAFAPDRVLDCGAHIGMFSLFAKSRFPKAQTIAFEPNPHNVRIIRRQIKINRLDIEVMPTAVAAEAKSSLFFGENSHSGRLVSDCRDSRAYRITTTDLPATVRDFHEGSILIKLDVEGEERNILPRLMPVLPRQTAIFFETHDGETGWREIETLLTANGFQVEKINARGLFYDGFASRS